MVVLSLCLSLIVASSSFVRLVRFKFKEEGNPSPPSPLSFQDCFEKRKEANFYLEKSKIFYMRSKLSLLEDRQRKKWKTKE